MRLFKQDCNSSTIIVGLLFGILLSGNIRAQAQDADSLGLINLSEVVIIRANDGLDHQKQQKPLSTLDEFLESSRSIKMVKRGAYAWEPTMNDMASERLAITIDEIGRASCRERV